MIVLARLSNSFRQQIVLTVMILIIYDLFILMSIWDGIYLAKNRLQTMISTKLQVRNNNTTNNNTAI